MNKIFYASIVLVPFLSHAGDADDADNGTATQGFVSSVVGFSTSALDGFRRTALSVVKSSAYCLLAFSSPLSAYALSYACPNHHILQSSRAALNRGHSACYSYECSNFRHYSDASCFNSAFGFPTVSCINICGHLYPQPAARSVRDRVHTCQYSKCNQLSIPDFGLGCSYTEQAIEANRCFAKNFCEKHISFTCKPDRQKGFWDRMTGPSGCSITTCPGLYVDKQDLPDADTVKQLCLELHCR